mmetsp:Transcript_128119/g.370901  ORF Transcript_128119/g.370901 Transcript_128119/m.370901 type:complete len:346 (+) Transcript_128119:1-1038(+)
MTVLFLALLFPGEAERRQAVIASHSQAELSPGPSRRSAVRRMFSSAALLLTLARASSAEAQEKEGRLFDQLATDADGSLSKDDVLGMIATTFEAEIPDEKDMARYTDWWGELFNQADLDQDERLSPTEVDYMSFLADRVWASAASRLAEAAAEGGDFDDFDILGSLPSIEEEPNAMLEEFDKNDDGAIDKDEFLTQARAFLDEDGVVDSDIEEFFQTVYEEADVSGDGVLDARESQFLQYLIHESLFPDDYGSALDMEEDKLRHMLFASVFEKLDENGDGRVTSEEMAVLLNSLGGEGEGENLPSVVLALKAHLEKAAEETDRGLDQAETEQILSEMYPRWGEEF